MAILCCVAQKAASAAQAHSEIWRLRRRRAVKFRAHGEDAESESTTFFINFTKLFSECA